ncbi:two-component regulator propeller domain-containing protein [Rudanella lutea]|uniref:two-component regulator propeller domain-containing protein n=1 Tax=Rudanella lutea TaxID=451374 RepID=UPI0003609AC6|nr:two-component regulator propeller domain-containing protein [Rudanella lutea]
MNLRHVLPFLGLLVALARPDALSQPDGIAFSHLTVEEGLSQSSVYAIVQDTQGFMWFGTRDGLNRYDARRVNVYQYPSGRKGGFASNTINALLLDRSGQLWAGTSKGLTRYRPQQDDFERISIAPADFAEVPDSLVNALLEDSHRNLWVGTQRGLYRLRRESLRYESVKKLIQTGADLSSRQIRTLYEDPHGILWVGTANGLTRLRPTPSGRFELTNYSLESGSAVYQNAFNGVNAVAEDRQGRLWLGTERNGVLLFDRQQGRVISHNAVPRLDLSTQAVRSIQPDGKGDFWIGTMSGLFIVAQDGSRFRALMNHPADPNSLNDNSVRSIFRDRDGSMWVGTYYGGVDMYSPLARQFSAFRPVDRHGSVPFKTASAMLPASGGKQLWLGTEDRGLFLINPDKTIARHFLHDPADARSLSSDRVKCLLADGAQGLWIGTLKGLNYLNLTDGRISRFSHEPNNPNSLPNDRIYDIKRDTDGTLWIATNLGGLCRFDPRTRTFEAFKARPQDANTLSANGTTCLLLDNRHQLWVGTVNGLNRNVTGQNTFVRMAHRDGDTTSLSSNHITCLFQDRKGRLWVGTRDTGLNLLLPDGHTFRHFGRADGFASNMIVSIQEDSHGRLWISTDKGLTEFEPDDGYRVVSYNRYDGLVCKEFTPYSSYQDPAGQMYFGGFNGIITFHPDSIRPNRTAPRLAFAQLRLFNEPVAGLPLGSADEGLTFTHEQNVFSIDFAAFNYVNSAKNRYAYRLVGFDKDWNYVSEPRAMYMNLSPGHYTLQVKGSNNDAVWNQKPLELSIDVLPPFWKTPWAYLLYALVFVGLLRLWSGFNQSRLQLAHELEVEHLEKLRQQELHQTKLNFFTEIAHEIRTPLTLVLGPVEVLTDRYADDPFVQKQVTLVRNSTGRLLRLLNQLLDFRKHETGNIQLQPTETDLVVFLRQITDSFGEHARSANVLLTNEAEVDTLPAWIDAGELEKVMYNLLQNAFKFTPAGGTISVRLQQDFGLTENAIIVVEDTGCGMPATDLQHIFDRFYQAGKTQTRELGFGLGLALSQQIVAQHQGQISVESREANSSGPGFTRFTITLPVRQLAGSAPLPTTGPVALLADLPPADTSPDTQIPSPSVPRNSLQSVADKPIILVVEDQDDIRMYVRDLFTDSYQVFEAADGQVAWEKAAQVLPDLIITDVAMPHMDGFALTHKLKSDPRTSHIPVIMLTAKDSMEHQLTGLQTGADDYVAKPFHPLLLVARVRNLLLVREQLKAKYHRLVTLQPQAPELEHPDAKFLNQLMAVLNANLADPEFNVTSLVGEMGMSRPVLFRKVKMLTDMSVIDLLRTTRLKKAEQLLRQRKASVAEIAFAVGFSDPKYFSRAFRSQFGQTPSEYSAQAAVE